VGTRNQATAIDVVDAHLGSLCGAAGVVCALVRAVSYAVARELELTTARDSRHMTTKRAAGGARTARDERRWWGLRGLGVPRGVCGRRTRPCSWAVSRTVKCVGG
jgi:hypothetical protein